MPITRDGRDSDIQWKTRLSEEAQDLVSLHKSDVRSRGDGAPYNIPTMLDEMTGREIRQTAEALEAELLRLKYLFTCVKHAQDQIIERFTDLPRPYGPRYFEPPHDRDLLFEQSEDLDEDDD